MRRTLVVILAALLLTGCTLGQRLRYAQAHLDGHGAQADAAAQAYFAEKAAATAGKPCPEWYDTAMEAGWTPQQWAWPLADVMYGESRCNPGADSPLSTARGLMQILRGWTGACGITYEQLHDALTNLRCALLIQRSGGWDDWEVYNNLT